MGKYNINSFQVGDQVHHLSNRSLPMVAVEINSDLNEISCRWVDKGGVTHREQFLPQELGKANDLSPRIIAL